MHVTIPHNQLSDILELTVLLPVPVPFRSSGFSVKSHHNRHTSATCLSFVSKQFENGTVPVLAETILVDGHLTRIRNNNFRQYLTFRNIFEMQRISWSTYCFLLTAICFGLIRAVCWMWIAVLVTTFKWKMLVRSWWLQQVPRLVCRCARLVFGRLLVDLFPFGPTLHSCSCFPVALTKVYWTIYCTGCIVLWGHRLAGHRPTNFVSSRCFLTVHSFSRICSTEVSLLTSESVSKTDRL